jgi:hypothetical protein
MPEISGSNLPEVFYRYVRSLFVHGLWSTEWFRRTTSPALSVVVLHIRVDGGSWSYQAQFDQYNTEPLLLNLPHTTL